MLIAFRALQGAAGAILSPSVFSIVTVTFEEGKERNTALGILGGIAGSGAAIGVLLGGVLTEYCGLGVDLLRQRPDRRAGALLRAPFRSGESPEGIARSFDAGGAFAVTGSLMVLVFALTQASQKGWGSAQTIALLSVSAALMVAFLLIESRARTRCSRWGSSAGARRPERTSSASVSGRSVFGMFFLLSLYMQQVSASRR